MDTLLLDQKRWDVILDVNGNIAVASDPYSTAQDVASICRVDEGEMYYDTTQGVPLYSQFLGFRPPLSSMRQAYIKAAMTVEGVTEAQCFFSGLDDRKLTGQIQVTTATGALQIVGF